MTTAATISARLVLDQSDYSAGLDLARQNTKNFENKLRTIGSNLSSVGRTMSTAFTAPIILGATAAGNAFVGLDMQLRNIQSITDYTDADLAQLSDRFITMSAGLDQTTDSAAKLAEGFYFVVSSGFAGEDAMTVLAASTKAASAGLTDTMTASQAITATLNAYNLSADKASWVSDILFKTVDKGVLTFEELAHQVGDVVSTGNIAQIGIDQVGAALSVMTRKGISAAEATTALNQLMLQFISPSAKQKDAAEEMGVSLDVATLRSLGLAGALQDIIEKGGGTDALLTLFGDNVRALKGALALGGDGVVDFSAMLEDFSDVAGRTDEAFAKQTQSMSAKLKNFKNVITSLGLDLASIFMPAIMEVVDAIKPWIEKFKELSPHAKKIGVIILAIVAIIGPLLIAFGAMATAISAIIALISTIGLPVIGIVLLIAGAAYLLYLAWTNNWGGIQEKVAAAWAVIEPILTSLWNALLLLITGDFKGGIFGLYEDSPFILFLIAAHRWIVGLPSTVANAVNSIRNWFVLGFTYLRSFLSGEMGFWSQLFSNTFNFVISTVQFFFGQFKILLDIFKAAWDGDWYLVGSLLRVALDNMINFIKLWGTTAWNNFNLILDRIKSNFQTKTSQIWENVKRVFSPELWQQLGSNLVQGLINGVNLMFTNFMNSLVNLASAAQQVWQGFWGMHSPSIRMEGDGINLVQGVINGVMNQLPRFQEAMMNVANAGARPFSGNQLVAAGAASGQSSTILPATNTFNVPPASGTGKTVNVTIQATVRSDKDVDYLAQQVAKRITRA